MIPRLAYGLVRSLARFLLAVFYGRVEVAGAERTPGTGPLIVAATTTTRSWMRCSSWRSSRGG